MEKIFAFACLVIYAYIALKFLNLKAVKKEEEPEQYKVEVLPKYETVREQVIQMSNLRNDIDTLEEMITDITCNPKLTIRNVDVYIPATDRKYTFMVDGSCEYSKKLIELLEMERDKLTSSLFDNFKKIS